MSRFRKELLGKEVDVITIMVRCSICFRVCSFTKSNTAIHRLVKWFIRNVPQLNRLWVLADDMMGYNKISDPSRYWEEN